MSYTSSPFSPYLGALDLQFALGPFYTFVALSLMVIYQLESIHLDDSNLIYSQNKNRGFTKILTAFPLLYNMILMHSIQIFFFSNQFQCSSRVKIHPKTQGNYQITLDLSHLHFGRIMHKPYSILFFHFLHSNHSHLMPYTPISLIPNQFQHIIKNSTSTLIIHSL